MDLINLINRVSCFDKFEDENIIWFSCYEKNALCQYDKISHSTKILAEFFDYPSNARNLYNSIKKVGDNIFVMPSEAKDVVVYNLKNEKVSYIKLIKPSIKKRKEVNDLNFWTSEVYGKYIYAFGYSYPAILKLNTETMKIEYLLDWVEELEKRIVEERDNRGYCLDGEIVRDYIYIPCGCTSSVLKLNLITDKIDVINLNVSVKGFGGLSYDGDSFWLVGRGEKGNTVIKWNEKSGLIKEFLIGESFTNNKENAFWKPIITDEKIFLFPILAKHIYVINRKTENVSIWSDMDKIISNKVYIGKSVTSLPHLKNNIISFILFYNNMWCEYDLKKETLEQYEVLISKNNKLLNKEIISPYCFEEKFSNAVFNDCEKRITLNMFFELVLSNENTFLNSIKPINKIGKEIHSVICKINK